MKASTASRSAFSPREDILNTNDDFFKVAEGVYGIKDLLVNMYLVSNPADETWVLLDAGLKTSSKKIKQLANGLFGEGARPSCIVLTHGHFDHVGSLKTLADEWDVPVYAHSLEMPYLTGLDSYPPPDPFVGGGMMALMSGIYPKRPIDISDRVRVMPKDGRVPGLPEWRCIFTPGHSPGHVSFFRESDRLLIAGDAFVTTRQESLLYVMSQEVELNGPPKYFTCDWQAAAESVRVLAAFEPLIIATGHGKPMRGVSMREELHKLADNFEQLAKPEHGRYVDTPARTDEAGVHFVPRPSAMSYAARAAGVLAVAGLSWYLLRKRRRE